MATAPTSEPKKSRMALAVSRWLAERGATPLQTTTTPTYTRPVDGMVDGWEGWLSDPVSLQFLAGTGNRPMRSRQQIYEKWQFMLGDPIISSALRQHVTGALGGHESKGKMVFIEAAPKPEQPAAKPGKKGDGKGAAVPKDNH